jgi:hypothetical protein
MPAASNPKLDAEPVCHLEVAPHNSIGPGWKSMFAARLSDNILSQVQAGGTSMDNATCSSRSRMDA